MGDDGRVISEGTGQLAAVTGLQIAHNHTFQHQTGRKNVSDLELGAFSTVRKPASVYTLDGDEQLLPELQHVRVTEVHDRQRGTTAWIVDDVL